MSRLSSTMLILTLAAAGIPFSAAQTDQHKHADTSDYPPDLTETARPALPQDYFPGGQPALAAPPPSQTIMVRDVVVSNTDKTLKDTNTSPNGEPSIAINPANPNEIVVLAFTGSWGATAPLWYSSDGGNTWTLENTIPNPTGLSENCPCDQTPDWAATGRMSATFLHYDSHGTTTNPGIDAYSATTSDPAVEKDWGWFVSGKTAQTTNQHGIGKADQPWLLVNEDPKNNQQRNVYVGYDNFAGAPDIRVAVAPGSDPPDFTEDNLVGFGGGNTNPGLRLAKDPRSRAIYSLWQVCNNADPHCTSSNGALDPKTIDFYLNRSTDGGKTWNLNGFSDGLLLAETLSTQLGPKFGTVNGLYGGTDHVAVDPNNGDVYVVYGNRDSTTGMNRLSILRLVPDAKGNLSFVGTWFVTNQSDTALPSVAVAQNANGTIGVLYTRFDGIDSTTKLPKFSAWLAISDTHGQSFIHYMLESFLSTTTDNGQPKQRILGDYQQIKAVGSTLYGVFSGNGVPFGRPFANIDPIFFSAPVN